MYFVSCCCVLLLFPHFAYKFVQKFDMIFSKFGKQCIEQISRSTNICKVSKGEHGSSFGALQIFCLRTIVCKETCSDASTSTFLYAKLYSFLTQKTPCIIPMFTFYKCSDGSIPFKLTQPRDANYISKNSRFAFAQFFSIVYYCFNYFLVIKNDSQQT